MMINTDPNQQFDPRTNPEKRFYLMPASGRVRDVVTGLFLNELDAAALTPNRFFKREEWGHAWREWREVEQQEARQSMLLASPEELMAKSFDQEATNDPQGAILSMLRALYKQGVNSTLAAPISDEPEGLPDDEPAGVESFTMPTKLTWSRPLLEQWLENLPDDELSEMRNLTNRAARIRRLI